MYVLKEFVSQIQALIPLIFYEFSLGLGSGWVAPTLRRLQDESYAGFSLTYDQASWIAALPECSRIVAPLLAIPLLHRMGRTGVLLSATALCLISTALVALTKSIPVIYFSRLLYGVANGIYIPAACLYLCETVKPAYRAPFGTILIACFYGGTLAEFCLVNYLTYRTTTYVNVVIVLVGLFTHSLSVETPEYLLSRRRNEEALQNFLRLRGSKVANAALTDTFERVKKYAEQNRHGEYPIRTFLASAARRRSVATVLLFNLLASATGISAIISYVSIVFVEGVFSATEYTILFGALQLIAALFGAAVIANVNRRTFLTVSLLVSVFAHLNTATLLYCQTQMIYVPHSSWCVFATITAYAMTFSSCIMPNAFLVAGELLPQNMRSVGSGIGTFAFGLVGFVQCKAFWLVDGFFGVYWNFVWYAAVSSVLVLFVRVMLPEIRGKLSVKIQVEIQSKDDAEYSATQEQNPQPFT